MEADDILDGRSSPTINYVVSGRSLRSAGVRFSRSRARHRTAGASPVCSGLPDLAVVRRERLFRATLSSAPRDLASQGPIELGCDRGRRRSTLPRLAAFRVGFGSPRRSRAAMWRWWSDPQASGAAMPPARTSEPAATPTNRRSHPYLCRLVDPRLCAPTGQDGMALAWVLQGCHESPSPLFS